MWAPVKVQLITNQPLVSKASACCALRSVHMYSSCILDEGPVAYIRMMLPTMDQLTISRTLRHCLISGQVNVRTAAHEADILSAVSFRTYSAEPQRHAASSSGNEYSLYPLTISRTLDDE